MEETDRNANKEIAYIYELKVALFNDEEVRVDGSSLCEWKSHSMFLSSNKKDLASSLCK